MAGGLRVIGSGGRRIARRYGGKPSLVSLGVPLSVAASLDGFRSVNCSARVAVFRGGVVDALAGDTSTVASWCCI